MFTLIAKSISIEIKIYRNILNTVCIFRRGEKGMKGRTTCPKCKHEFVLDVPDDHKEHEVTCPKCENKFTIRTTSSDSKSKDECHWEEHGEPRKTILSSIRPKTNKPTIATILLVCVFAIGIGTAVFAETFTESSLGILSDTGLTGTVELSVIDQSNNESLENVNITIGDISGSTDEDGSYSVENVSLGIQKVELSLSEYKTQIQEILVIPFITSYHEIKMEKGTGEKQFLFNSGGCTIILAIFAVFALIGAITTLKRQHFDVAVAGSVLGILSFGFFMIGSILGIIALIIIIKSREEFKNGKKGKIF